jgi:hypothetical protein
VRSTAGLDEVISSSSSLSPWLLRASEYAFAIEKLSRNVPPRSEAATRTPALVGPSRMVFHSSSLKSALVVISLLSPLGLWGNGHRMRDAL